MSQLEVLTPTVDLQRYNETTRLELRELLSLKGKKDAVSVERRRRVRRSLRNQGILSLPFSMNLKKEPLNG